nr:hypothetical protein [Streptomyces sp. SCL15-4]
MSQQPVLLPYSDPAFLADPFPLYRRLREEGPVRRAVIAGGLEAWLVTRYADALAALSDPRLAAMSATPRTPASPHSCPASSASR